MRVKYFSVLLVFCLAVVGAIVPVHAQGIKKIVSDVAFEFSVGGKNFPAGTYHVVQPTDKSLVLVVSSEDGEYKTRAKILARLSRNGSADGRMVFNVSEKDGRRFLSEIWMPGEDGFLVQGTGEGHEHITISSN